MKKSTKRFKNNKFNKTFKKGGDKNETVNENQNSISENNNEINSNENNNNEINDNENTIGKNGIIGYIGNTLKSGADKLVEIGDDAGLRALGLERVNKDDENEAKKPPGLLSKISENIQNVANKTGATLIENTNEVLGSSTVKENIQQASQNTASILKENAKIVNNALNDPEVKQEVIQATNKLAEIGNVAIEASREPINKAAEVTAQAATKALAATSSGSVKVLTDFAGAIPGVGAIIDTLKAVNDGSKAISNVVEASSDAIEAGSNLIIETKNNFKKAMEILEKKKQLAQQISNRTNKSINDFENPLNNLSTQTAGGRKTKRRFLKCKSKSKRVRFAI
jgi:Na+/phosphate symporter